MALSLLLSLQTQPKPAASAMVSKVLARYAGAKTVVGKIAMVQTMGSISASVTTELQYERPAKLYIRQVRKSSDPREWMVTSDGAQFSYEMPWDLTTGRPKERLIEDVKQQGKSLDLRDMYAAAARSLGDRSAPLDILISRSEDLKFLANQWATLGYLSGDAGPIILIGGQWREYGQAPVSGTWQMEVTPEGDLKSYRLEEAIAPDPKQGPQKVTTVWTVDVSLSAAPDPAKFKLLK